MRTRTSLLAVVVLMSVLLPGGTASAVTAAGSCFRYGDVVTLRFILNNRLMSAGDYGAVNIDRTQAFQWEKFLIIDPNNLSNAGTIPNGGVIALRTYKHNNYLRADSTGAVRADSRALNPDARWRLSSTGQCTYLGFTLRMRGLLLTDNQTRLIVPGGAAGYPAVTQPVPGNTANWDVLLTRAPWTDFYYDVPWRTPGFDQDCPYRGRWDGANCFVARSPYPHPFVWHDNFYGNGTGCAILGWYDGAHCQIGTNPAGSHTPFVFQGSWYLGKGQYASLSCIDDSSLQDDGVLKGCGKHGAIQVSIEPMTPNYNNTIPPQLVSQTPIPIPNIQSFRVCYKKTITFGSPCSHNQVYTGSPVKEISGLQTHRKYKLQGFFTLNGSNERAVGQIKVKTT
jgi:hypothetical protein